MRLKRAVDARGNVKSAPTLTEGAARMMNQTRIERQVTTGFRGFESSQDAKRERERETDGAKALHFMPRRGRERAMESRDFVSQQDRGSRSGG